MRPLRIAVVGAGYMGRRHAAKVAELSRRQGSVALSGVADLDAGRAGELASQHGVASTRDPLELAAKSDAAIVAVPTSSHFDVVAALLRALDVLVEKPIAATLEEAEALLGLARSGGRVLQVGHLERFHRALTALNERIRRPRFVEAHRLGPFPERGTDVDVVRDLMIHDLDVVQQLVGEEPERVEAVGVPVLTRRVDIANARVTFPGGCVANLTASRVSPTPLRKIRFFQPHGYFSIDLLDHKVVIFRRPEGAPQERRIEMETLAMDPGDALLSQLGEFLESVRTRAAPAVPGEQALFALRTALRVVEAIPPPDELDAAP